jgi:hypothetical protein
MQLPLALVLDSLRAVLSLSQGMRSPPESLGFESRLPGGFEAAKHLQVSGKFGSLPG